MAKKYKYKIVRFRETGDREVVMRGLTLKQAQKHCKDPQTKGIDSNGVKWFDGYDEER